jgi:hypothetical protein
MPTVELEIPAPEQYRDVLIGYLMDLGAEAFEERENVLLAYFPAARWHASTPRLLRQRRRAKKRNPTGRKIRRDAWLAPLTLDQQILSLQPQVHTAGVRASDKGFLQLSWRDYFALLRWTAKQAIEGVVAKVPPQLASLLASLGIDAAMWRDLVWNFKKYFGRGVCAGSPTAMAEDAQRHGRSWHRGQKLARNFFAAA